MMSADPLERAKEAFRNARFRDDVTTQDCLDANAVAADACEEAGLLVDTAWLRWCNLKEGQKGFLRSPPSTGCKLFGVPLELWPRSTHDQPQKGSAHK